MQVLLGCNHTVTHAQPDLLATCTACKLKQLTFLCMPLQAPAECAPFLAAGGSPAPLEAALTGPSLHTSSSIHGSVVAPNPMGAF